MQMHAAIPILRIFSEDKAREFYLDFLGFRVDWEHRFEASFPLYLKIGRSHLKLHLSGHHGDATPGSTAFIHVDDVASLHAELHAKAYPFAKPSIDIMDWGRVLQVADPYGNRRRFCELTGDWRRPTAQPANRPAGPCSLIDGDAHCIDHVAPRI